MSRYADIIQLKRPVSKYPKMSLHDRAAQFSPFAALTGYDDEISEAGRLTGNRIELTDEEKDTLDRTLKKLTMDIEAGVYKKLTITYFEPDALKDGGSYQTMSDIVKKIDLIHRSLQLDSKQVLNLEDIVLIEEKNDDLTL